MATLMGAITPVAAQPGDTGIVPPIADWARQQRAVRSVRYPGMGAVPSSDTDFKSNPKFQVRALSRGERPSRVLLTEYLPPVGYQGSQNSCVGWSTAYYSYSYAVARRLKLTPEQRLSPRFQFSPAFIYHLANGGRDAGMPISGGVAVLRDRGCASLAEMPWQQEDVTSKPSEEAAARAGRYRAPRIASLFRGLTNYGDPADIEKLKTYLADSQQPFIMGIPIFEDFPMGQVSGDFVYRLSVVPDPNKFMGLHCITVVGYDDDKKAFRMVNSWGTSWGDGGFLWLDEEFVRKYAVEGWSFVPGGPGQRALSTSDRRALRVSPQVTIEAPVAAVPPPSTSSSMPNDTSKSAMPDRME